MDTQAASEAAFKAIKTHGCSDRIENQVKINYEYFNNTYLAGSPTWQAGAARPDFRQPCRWLIYSCTVVIVARNLWSAPHLVSSPTRPQTQIWRSQIHSGYIKIMNVYSLLFTELVSTNPISPILFRLKFYIIFQFHQALQMYHWRAFIPTK